MIETSCLQFWNSPVSIFSNMVCKTFILIIELIKLYYQPKLIDFIGCSWKYNVNDIYNLKAVFLDANKFFV